jgi:purine-binding chemotaxis protein CheW
MAATNNQLWLVFELAQQAYGFNVDHVQEIVSLRNTHIHRMPQASTLAEGVVLLRNRPIDVLDVRSALGMRSLHQETEGIANLLEEREQDHCRWIQELEACVGEQREFRLATDPHKCKFGQWYDQVRADPHELSQLTNNDLALTSLLDELDQPHQRIHGVAHRVLAHATAGRIDEARQILTETRNTELSSLRQTFAKCREQIGIVRRGLLFVLAHDDGVFGGLVDRVSEVVKFTDDQIRPVDDAYCGNGMLAGVAQRGDTGKMVQLLNVSALASLRQCGSAGLSCPA